MARRSSVSLASVVQDLKRFFTDPAHEVYISGGTPSNVTPSSIYHIMQLEVLFEDKYFHWLTNLAITEMRQTGFLSSIEVDIGSGAKSTLVWRSNVRYVRRQIETHKSLLAEYSSPLISAATGQYAELLTDLGLAKLGLAVVARNGNSYSGNTWTTTGHDLDFVAERDGVAYGVEVKNTFAYIPDDELQTKLAMCQALGLRPLFIVRSRHSRQWEIARRAGGMLFTFKSKVFPPGMQPLVDRIWNEMRLPVIVWSDWRPQFYSTLQNWIAEPRLADKVSL